MARSKGLLTWWCWRPKTLAVLMDPRLWFPFIFLLCSLCLRFLFVFLSDFWNQEDDGVAGLLWIGCWFWVFCRDKNNGENQYPSLCFSLIFLFFRCFFFALFCALFGFPLSPGFRPLPFHPPSSRGCIYPGFYRAGRSIGAVTAGSNGVGRSIQWRNVPAFNGGAATGEEDERTVASQNDSVFTIPKAAFNLVLGIL